MNWCEHSMSYEKKLMAMKGLVKATKSHPSETRISIPAKHAFQEKWEKAGLELVQTEFGVYYKKTMHFSFDMHHGNSTLQRLNELMTIAIQQFPGHPLTPKNLQRIYFYDTETTGLKGVGVHIFMNGLLTSTKTGYKLEQYLLASPDQELAFLKAIPFQTDDTVVTYNGKSFDLPQLEVRWTLNRKHLDSFPSIHQIDLLHGSKRLWKGEQERYKLQDMEREQLDFHRQDDLPGHLAPIVYFDAIKTGNTENLLRVFEHNQWDLLSLVALYIRSLMHLTDHVHQPSANVELNLAKWLKDLKYLPHSEELYKKVIERYEQHDIPHAYYYLALFQKRNGEIKDSVRLMKIAADLLQGREQLEASIHCAKLCEHQLKDFELAYEYVQTAKRQLLKLTGELKREKLTDYLQNIKVREARIHRKIISRESAGFDK